MSEQSNQTSIEELLHHSSWLRGLARSLVQDPHTADDLVQATWNKALENPPRNVDSPKHWLARLLRNTFYSDYRSAKRRTSRESKVAQEDRAADQAQVIERGEINLLLADAVMKLEDPYRTTILMRFHEEQSAAEIGRRLGIPASTVRSHIKRGLAQLRTELSTSWGKDWSHCSAALLSFSTAGHTVLSASKVALVVSAASLIVAPMIWNQSNDFDVEPASMEANLTQVEDEGLITPPPTPMKVAMPVVAGATETRRPSTINAVPPAVDGHVVYKGRAVTEDGNPLPGATFELETSATRRRGPETIPWQQPGTVTTADDGLFELSFQPLPKGVSLKLILSAPGRISRVANWEYLLHDLVSRDLGDVILEKGALLSGKVVCDEGEFPKRKMVVTALGISGYSLFPESPVEYNIYSITDEQGRFEMKEGLPAGAHPLRLSAKGYENVGDMQTEIAEGEIMHEITLHLKQLPFVSGRVVMADGTVPGPVILRKWESPRADGPRSSAWSSTDGTFQLPSTKQSLGDTDFAIQVIDQEGVGVQAKLTEEKFNWGDRDVIIQLDPTLHFDIQVVDDASGKPVEDYAVICREEEIRFSFDTQGVRFNGFHKDGVLRVDNLNLGTHYLQIIPSGNQYTKTQPVEVQGTFLDLAPMVIRLKPMIPITVSLRTESGTPVKGSTVSLQGISRIHPVVSSAVSDENGTCTLMWPHSVDSGVVRVTGAHATVEKKVRNPISNAEGIEITVIASGLVTGTIALAPEAVGKMELYFMRMNGRVIEPPPDELTLKPAEDGSFEINLDPGKYQVIALYPNPYASRIGFGFNGGWTNMEPALTEFVVASGATPELKLDATHFAPAKLTGTITLDGAPAANFPVELILRSLALPMNATATLSGIMTDAQGKFEVNDLMPGAYQVYLKDPGNQPPWSGQLQCNQLAVVRPGKENVVSIDANFSQFKVRPLHPDTKKPMPNSRWTLHLSGYKVLTADESGWILIAPAPQEPVMLTSFGQGKTTFQTKPIKMDSEQTTRAIDCPTTKHTSQVLGGFK
jgi:RNA polymerase sigma factor (sigma-70 family)